MLNINKVVTSRKQEKQIQLHIEAIDTKIKSAQKKQAQARSDKIVSISYEMEALVEKTKEFQLYEI